MMITVIIFFKVGWIVCFCVGPKVELLTWNNSPYIYLLIISHAQNAVIRTGKSTTSSRNSYFQLPYISIQVSHSADKIKHNTSLPQTHISVQIEHALSPFLFCHSWTGKPGPHLLSPLLWFHHPSAHYCLTSASPAVKLLLLKSLSQNEAWFSILHLPKYHRIWHC